MKCTDCKNYEFTTRWCLYAEDYVRWPSQPQTTCRGYESPDAELGPCVDCKAKATDECSDGPICDECFAEREERAYEPDRPDYCDTREEARGER